MPPRKPLPKGDASQPIAANTAATAAAAEDTAELIPESYSITVPLPDQPGACNFIVEFPGYIKNEDRALATFGGLDGLAAQRQTHPKTLQLRLRPGDPSCHPLISDDAKSTTVLVLKLTRSRHPHGKDGLQKMQTDDLEDDSDDDKMSEENDRDGVKAEIVAVADKTYAFSAPADFQYAGQDRRPFEVQWVARADRAEDDPEFLPKEPLLCTPSMFAVEPAVDYAFKQYKAAEHGLDVLGRKPKRGMGITWVDYFAPEVPSVDTKTLGGGTGATPGVGVGNDTTTAALNGQGSGGGGGGGSISSIGQVLVSRLEMAFNRRPVYLESALGAALGTIENGDSGGGGGIAGASTSSNSSSTFTSFPATRSQQELLSKLCYRFKNGPWKGTWVLRGYDPRAEPAARQYQVLEYSLPVEWWKKVLTHKNRVAKQLQQLQLHSSSTRDTTAVNTTTTLGNASSAGGLSAPPGLPPVAPSYTALCSFSGVQSTQTLQLQLCDIDDSEIRSLLAETSNVAAGVSDGSGWLTQSAWEGIKTKVAAKFGALWEAAAAQAANFSNTTTAAAAAGNGHSGGAGIGIIPPELMSELATYLEKGQSSKPAVAATTASSGGKRQGATGEQAARSVRSEAGDGTADARGSAPTPSIIEAVDDEDEEEEEEDEVEVEEDEDDEDDDGDA